jgi:hypothetical protein
MRYKITTPQAEEKITFRLFLPLLTHFLSHQHDGPRNGFATNAIASFQFIAIYEGIKAFLTNITHVVSVPFEGAILVTVEYFRTPTIVHFK